MILQVTDSGELILPAELVQERTKNPRGDSYVSC
jgi:hypothetical protein